MVMATAMVMATVMATEVMEMGTTKMKNRRIYGIVC